MSEIKYLRINKISGETLLEAKACRDQFELYIKRYGFFDEIKDFEEFINYAKRQTGWIEFLLENNFINKIKHETTYQYGELFKIKSSHDNSTDFGLLTQVKGGILCMICIRSGNRWKNPLEVTDSTKVTKTEINNMIGNHTWEYLPSAYINIRHEGEIIA